MKLSKKIKTFFDENINKQVSKIVEPFKPAKMVNWYQPKMLLDTALKASISSTFGNYADRREMEAALAKDNNEDWEQILQLYRGEDTEEIWIDFISDTGDGFNSTFSVAKLAAEKELTVTDRKAQKKLPRASVVILGGDQVYPTPTADKYHQKFSIPYESALPKNSLSPLKRPHLYAIPGNHDWYDGLGNFIKLFCQQRDIGDWTTHQKRSYFALPLPQNCWIWATDIQLNADIDEPQQCYFREVMKKMQPDDKVILVTAEPAWINRELYADDKSNSRLVYFIEQFILNRQGKNGPAKFKLKAILTGDLHHYSRYRGIETNALCEHYLGAGGGGAFLHLTHCLPPILHEPRTGRENKDQQIPAYAKLVKVFPDRKKSRQLDAGNLCFAFINRSFGAFMGLIYLLVFWTLQVKFICPADFFTEMNKAKASGYLTTLSIFLFHAPFLLISTVLFGVAIYKFADKRSSRTVPIIIAFLHAMLQFILLYTVIIGTTVCTHVAADTFSRENQLIITTIIVFLSGWFCSGTVFGFYLFSVHNPWLRMHINEASSSLTCPNYKNFLRIRISKEGIRIFPIGIKKIQKQWKIDGEGEALKISGKIPAYELIEHSILIPH